MLLFPKAPREPGLDTIGTPAVECQHIIRTWEDKDGFLCSYAEVNPHAVNAVPATIVEGAIFSLFNGLRQAQEREGVDLVTRWQSNYLNRESPYEPLVEMDCSALETRVLATLTPEQVNDLKANAIYGRPLTDVNFRRALVTSIEEAANYAALLLPRRRVRAGT